MIDIAEKSQEAYSKENMSKRYMEEYDRTGYKKKILLINVNCKISSSTGKIVYDLYQDIRADGREAAICYGRGSVVEGKNIYKFGIDMETIIHAGLARVTGYNGCFSPISTERLIKYIDNYKPDLIHIHELHAYFVNIKKLIEYIKIKGIPVIWTFHCEYMYTGKCGHAYECINFQQKCGNCSAVRDYPKSLWFDKTRQMLAMKKELLADWDFTIVTPSQWLADRVKISFLKNKKIKVINNGIDTGIFRPVDASDLRKELGIPKENKVVLAVAPDIMSERKGGGWILELAEKMKNENTTFVLVGQGTIPKTLPSNVMCVGVVYDPYILAYYYSMADAFVICSKRETYSMTCAEALCCGTPVIGFESGAPETVFFKPFATFVKYGALNSLMDELLKNLNMNNPGQ